jgi:Na+/melibiose symporter-like transporter
VCTAEYKNRSTCSFVLTIKGVIFFFLFFFPSLSKKRKNEEQEYTHTQKYMFLSLHSYFGNSELLCHCITKLTSSLHQKIGIYKGNDTTQAF